MVMIQAQAETQAEAAVIAKAISVAGAGNEIRATGPSTAGARNRGR